MNRMETMLALAAVVIMTMVGCLAVAEQAPQDETEALLTRLTARQSELLDKAYPADQADDAPTEDDYYSPQRIKMLSALTPQEEEQFNQVYAQINQIMDEYEQLEGQWEEKDAPADDQAFLDSVADINERLDALWAQVQPQVNKLELARIMAHLKDMGLTDDERARYLASDEKVQALNSQMEKLYEGWAAADEKRQEAIQQQADALYAKIAEEYAAIGDLIDKINQAESDRYYAGLTALTQAERDELRSIEQQLNEIYSRMEAEEPEN